MAFIVWGLFAARAVLAQDAAPTPAGPLHLSRWNIDHGQYLIEIGQYLEALEAFQTAIQATTHPRLRAIAHLHRASVLAIYLDALDDAAREYRRILREYGGTRLAETALFRLGMLRLDQQRYRDAASRFQTYLRRYPEGRFAGSAETLLRHSRQAIEQPIPPSPTVSPLPDRPGVRVRLLKAAGRVVIDGEARLTVISATGQTVHHGPGPVMLRPGVGHILVQRRSTGDRTLRITSAAPLTLMQKDIRCGRRQPASPGRYRGALRISLQDGKLEVVNEVDIEAYLYGVVPAEAYSTWPPEALEAQAIAARTYALYQSQRRRNRGFDLVDSQGDQVYKGIGCETGPTNRAVDATRGTLLLYRQRPILAMYTANTGWHSAHAKHIFGQPLPYLVGVEDPWSPTQPMGRWQRTYGAVEIRRRLARIGIRVDEITDIRSREVTPSGRIRTVALVHAGGVRVVRARTTLKRTLDLPEVLLRITRRGDAFVFDGGGFGHGMGLSQWGAKAMAEAGRTAEEILSFYYHDVRQRRAW